MMAEFNDALKSWSALASAVIALIAMFISISNARKSKASAALAKAEAETTRRLHQGEAETNLRESISRARERYEDICLRLADLVNGRKFDDLLKPEKARAEQYRKVQLSSLESLMNSYENACAKYRDDKIDKDRFKKLYIEEIRTLFSESDNCYSRYLHPEGTSKFKAIWAVYRAWNDLENKSA